MHPDPITPENPTLSALGLEKPLPPNAPSEQQAAAREVHDAVALTWLAVSDLQPAPESIWRGIQSQITPAIGHNPTRRRWQIPITYSGWAAAAALALGWWLQDTPPATTREPNAVTNLNTKPSQPAITEIPNATPTDPRNPENSKLREELLQLRQRLASVSSQPDIPGLHRPAIVELRAPDGDANPASPGDAAARLQQLVTRALQRDLILRDAGDASAIVLERGWPTANWQLSESGQTIRHLSFPADRWEELGLWKSPDSFYDPATSLTWAPAPDGLGYLGSVTPVPADATTFTKPRPKAEIQAAPAKPKMPSRPSGYLVSEPGSGDATLLLSDLPPVPEGGQQFVIASNANGRTQQYQIAGNSTTGYTSLSNTSTNTAFSVDSLTLSSLSLSGNFTNFQVVQTGPDRSTPTVLLTSGQH